MKIGLVKIGLVGVSGGSRQMQYAEFNSRQADAFSGLVTQWLKIRSDPDAQVLAKQTEREIRRLAVTLDALAARVAWMEGGGNEVSTDELAARLPATYLERLVAAAQESSWPTAVVFQNPGQELLTPGVVSPFAILVSIGNESRPSEVRVQFEQALKHLIQIRDGAAGRVARAPRLAERRSERAVLFLWQSLRKEGGPALRPSQISQEWQRLTRTWRRHRRAYASHLSPNVERNVVPAHEEWVKRSGREEKLGAREVHRIIEQRAQPRFGGS